MAKRGIRGYVSFGPTLAHTDEDIRVTAEATEETLRVIRQGLETIEDLMICNTRTEPLRRLVS